MSDNENDTGKDRWHLTGRAARRAMRFGQRMEKPLRSRIQRKSAKQRLHGPSGKVLARKLARRAKLIPPWLEAEQQWLDEQAAA